MCDRLGEHAGPEKGGLTGPNPVDRGKYGSKIHLVTERTGLPLSVGISGASTHDSQALAPAGTGIAVDQVPARPTSASTGQALPRQGQRLHPLAAMVHAVAQSRLGSNERAQTPFSDWADTIPWETLCSVTKRVPRLYRTSLGL